QRDVQYAIRAPEFLAFLRQIGIPSGSRDGWLISPRVGGMLHVGRATGTPPRNQPVSARWHRGANPTVLLAGLKSETPAQNLSSQTPEQPDPSRLGGAEDVLMQQRLTLVTVLRRAALLSSTM